MPVGVCLGGAAVIVPALTASSMVLACGPLARSSFRANGPPGRAMRRIVGEVSAVGVTLCWRAKRSVTSPVRRRACNGAVSDSRRVG